MNTWSESTDSYIYNYITHLIINFFFKNNIFFEFIP